MAAITSQQVSTVSISSASQTPRKSVRHDMQYYLMVGLEGVKRQKYRRPGSFSKAIDSLHDEFDSGNWSAGQYLVFVSVTEKHLESINRLRHRHHKGLGWMYLKSEEALVVKIIPGAVQQNTHLGLTLMLYEKINQMGLRYGLAGIGRTTFDGIIGQKEADSAFIPPEYRRGASWPTIVFECGLSQSLERLRVDSCWWLENSSEVNIVLLFSISKADKRLHLEQWEIVTTPNPRITRTYPDPLITTLTKINEIDIVDGVASGAPLTFNFQKVFLRPPVQGEGDIVFSAQDLERWAAHIWHCAQ